MSGWNKKETVLQFIEIYRTLPALWKVKSKEYGNKLTRELAYLKMIEFCRKFDPSADKQFVVNKINNLRSAFRKELKKVETSKLSGADRDEIYESRLWYFPYLMFIQDQEVPRSGTSNLDIENARPQSPSLGPSHSLESELPVSPSASSEISVGLDVPEHKRNENFSPIERLSQSSFFSGAPSQSISCSQVSPLVPSPGPSHSQGPSPSSSHSQGSFPGPSHSQGPSPGPSQSQGSFPGPSQSQGSFPVDSFPGPTHTSVYGTPQEFSGGPASKRPNNKRKSDDEEILYAARARLLNPTPPPPLDENESFGKTIALLLRNAAKEQRIYARKLMYEVMAEAELGNLSHASYFVASPDFDGANQSHYQKQ